MSAENQDLEKELENCRLAGPKPELLSSILDKASPYLAEDAKNNNHRRWLLEFGMFAVAAAALILVCLYTFNRKAGPKPGLDRLQEKYSARKEDDKTKSDEKKPRLEEWLEVSLFEDGVVENEISLHIQLRNTSEETLILPSEYWPGENPKPLIKGFQYLDRENFFHFDIKGKSKDGVETSYVQQPFDAAGGSGGTWTAKQRWVVIKPGESIVAPQVWQLESGGKMEDPVSLTLDIWNKNKTLRYGRFDADFKLPAVEIPNNYHRPKGSEHPFYALLEDVCALSSSKLDKKSLQKAFDEQVDGVLADEASFYVHSTFSKISSVGHYNIAFDQNYKSSRYCMKLGTKEAGFEIKKIKDKSEIWNKTFGDREKVEKNSSTFFVYENRVYIFVLESSMKGVLVLDADKGDILAEIGKCPNLEKQR